MKSLGYTPVPLETSDILPSIQTGMINVVPSTRYFALASQIHNTAPNMLDINWAPIVGALVVTRKAWDDMPPPPTRQPIGSPIEASCLSHQPRRLPNGKCWRPWWRSVR